MVGTRPQIAPDPVITCHKKGLGNTVVLGLVLVLLVALAGWLACG